MGGRLGVPGWTGHAGGRFRAGPPVSAAGPPLPRAWGPRPPAAGSSGRTARRSKCAPHTGSAGWALVPRSSSGFAALELYWPLSGCSLGNGPALRRAWTRPQLGPCKQGPQEPRPHLLQARLPSGPLGLHGGCTLVRRGAAGPAPASVGALRPQLRQVALSPPLGLRFPQRGHKAFSSASRSAHGAMPHEVQVLCQPSWNRVGPVRECLCPGQQAC